MIAFLSGAAGALAVLLVLAAGAGVARCAFRRRFHGRGHFGAVRLLRRIGASPDQERLVLAETDALAAELRAVRGDARGLREEVVRLLAAPGIDAAAVSAALDAHLAGLGRARNRAAEAFARIHAALDPEQRARLAELVRAGPRHGCARA